MANQITPNPSVPSQVVAEVKFPKFINNLGIIPTSYKDSMSYYECLAWLCKFLEEQVIPTVNENGEAVEELQALYVELNSFVTNYFDNLDVQEEINNKLDEMAESGVLQETLSIYFRDLENTYTERYNEIESEADNRYNSIEAVVNQMNQKLDSTLSGSPAGVYDTVEDLTTADPNHSKIYVVKSNGHWYYYDTTLSAWTSGGVYQSSVQNYDTTLTGNNEIPNSKSIGDRINQYYYKDNYFDPGSIIDGYYYNGAGTLTELSTYYCTTNPIHLNANDNLYFQYDGQNVNNLITHVIYCDNLGNFISRANQTAGLLTATEECYVLFNFVKNDSYPDYLTKSSFSINQPALDVPDLNYKSVNNVISAENTESINDVTRQYNYFDYENSLINGNIQSTGVYLKRAQNDYFTTNLIKCKSGDVFRCYYFGSSSTNYVLFQVCKYNSSKQFIERSSVNNKTYTCNFDGYLRFNCPKGASDLLDGYFLISKNETVTKYYPYKKFLAVEKDYDVKITKQDASNYLINFGKFSVVLFKTDDNENNLHNWNLKEIKNGDNTLVPAGTDILGPVKINDNDDFIGGIHGDETTNNLMLSIDGSSYNITEVNELSGNNLTILMKSSVYDEGTESKAFDRYITITISNNKIHVSCNYRASKNLTLKRATNGGLIACQNPIINSIMFNNYYFASAPTTSQNIGSRLNIEATINTIYGSITVRNITGHENENYLGYLNVFTNESPIRNKIYFDTYRQGSYSLNNGDVISGEFEYILS